MMIKEGITMRGFGEVLTIPMSDVLTENIFWGPPDRATSPFHVYRAYITMERFEFVIGDSPDCPSKGIQFYEVEGLGRFLNVYADYLKCDVRDLIASVKDQDVNQLLKLFYLWVREMKVCDCIAGMSTWVNGKPAMSYNEARKYCPELRDSPWFLKFLSELIENGRLYRGREKPQEFTWQVIKLYDLANRIYVENLGKSFEAARADALDSLPDLIPKNWSDPDEAFRKKARQLDSSPHSQLSYRNSR